MSNEGFIAVIPAKKSEEEQKRASLLDKGLDEIAADAKEARRKERQQKREEERPRRREDSGKQKILQCRLSRADLERIAKDQKININGYNVYVEAILTKKTRR